MNLVTKLAGERHDFPNNRSGERHHFGFQNGFEPDRDAFLLAPPLQCGQGHGRKLPCGVQFDEGQLLPYQVRFLLEIIEASHNILLRLRSANFYRSNDIEFRSISQVTFQRAE